MKDTIIGKTKNRDNTDFSEEELELLDFSKNTKLIEQYQINDTPFNMVITEEGNFISLGSKRITGKLTEQEAIKKEQEIKSFDWKMLLAAMSIIATEAVAMHHLEIMKWEAQQNLGAKKI